MSTWKRVLGTIVLTVLLLPATGCGSDESSPGVAVIEVTAVTSPLPVFLPTPFTVTGTNFLSIVGSDVVVRFTADGGETPFDGGTSATADVPGVAVSNTEVTGTSPASTFIGSFDAFVTVILPTTAFGTSALPIAEFVGVATNAEDDAYDVMGNGFLSRDAAAGVLVNDDPAGFTTVTSFDAVSVNGADVAVDPDGAFTYAPPAGFEGTDTFTYEISGGIGTDTATVTVTVGELAWFIDRGAAPGGDGRLMTPFDDIAPFAAIQGGLAEPGDTIFLYEAGGAAYDGPLVLLADQVLLGQGVDLVVGSETIVTATGNPLLSGAGGTTLTLGTDNTVRGLDIGNTAGEGIQGIGAGTLTADTVNIATTGGSALFLNGMDAAATFGTVSCTNSAGSGVAFANITGTVTVTGRTTITAPTTSALAYVLGTATLNFNGLNITTTTAGGIATTGDTQLNVTGTGNVISTTTGRPLDLQGLIGSNGVTFESVSCDGSDWGILVASTVGTFGSFTVTGDGSGLQNGSGGTLQNCTASGVFVDGATGVSLTQLDIDTTASHGILVQDANSFLYQDGRIDDAGDSDDEFGIFLLEVSGDVVIEDVEFDGINEDAIRLENSTADDATPDTFLFSGIDVLDHTAAGFGENGIAVLVSGTADVEVLVDNCTFDINTEGLLGVLGTSYGTASLEMAVRNCTFDAGDAFGSGCIQLQSGDTSTATYNVLENDLNASLLTSIIVNNDDDATTFATIRDNDIDADIAANGGFGISLRQDENGTFTVLVEDNTVDGHGFDGIRMVSRDTTDGTGTLNVTLIGNVVGAPTLFGPGLYLLASDVNTLCANIVGNDPSGNNFLPGSDDDIVLENSAASTLRVTQLAPTAAVDPSEIDDANNSATIGVTGAITWSQPPCPVPPIVP